MRKAKGIIIAATLCAAVAFPAAAMSTAGYENGNSSLDITMSAHYTSGSFNADGGVMEIVAYNKANGHAYAVNGQDGVLASIDIAGGDTELSSVDVSSIVAYSFSVKSLNISLPSLFNSISNNTVVPDVDVLYRVLTCFRCSFVKYTVPSSESLNSKSAISLILLITLSVWSSSCICKYISPVFLFKLIL